MIIEFTKYHGLGNDYLFLDALKKPDLLNLKLTNLAVSMSNRRSGPGSDGIVLFSVSNNADIKMRIFNPDGSEAESCGNALRCLGRICRERKYVASDKFSVETLGGIVQVILDPDDSKYERVSVDMGQPVFEAQKIPVKYSGDPLYCQIQLPDQSLDVACLNVGNPHCVIFLSSFTIDDVKNLGPLIEHHPMFPERVNAGFCRIVDRSTIDLTVWERGAGLTGACGTGATAAFAAALRRNLINDQCDVNMPGGTLYFQVASQGNIYMTGPAQFVYSGQISTSDINGY